MRNSKFTKEELGIVDNHATKCTQSQAVACIDEKYCAPYGGPAPKLGRIVY